MAVTICHSQDMIAEVHFVIQIQPFCETGNQFGLDVPFRGCIMRSGAILEDGCRVALIRSVE